jgi:hypothetical protein
MKMKVAYLCCVMFDILLPVPFNFATIWRETTLFPVD